MIGASPLVHILAHTIFFTLAFFSNILDKGMAIEEANIYKIMLFLLLLLLF